jgi:hypothetical protein
MVPWELVHPDKVKLVGIHKNIPPTNFQLAQFSFVLPCAFSSLLLIFRTFVKLVVTSF